MAKINEKNYIKMYKEVIEVSKSNLDEVGELVIMKYGITSETYKNSILRTNYSNILSQKDKEVLVQMIEVLNAYEENIKKVELPIAENLIDFYIASKYLTVKDFC
ncbi:MAG: hypothetical protein ILA19_00105, partial [Bacilli bacterium]|nr:hypothetical protein [Bacilli bacterium]